MCRIRLCRQDPPADARKEANKEAKLERQGSWGVCTALPFEGFVRFLRLCEEKAPFLKGVSIGMRNLWRMSQIICTSAMLYPTLPSLYLKPSHVTLQHRRLPRMQPEREGVTRRN